MTDCVKCDGRRCRFPLTTPPPFFILRCKIKPLYDQYPQVFFGALVALPLVVELSTVILTEKSRGMKWLKR
jgi:hypothetical protein